MVSLGISITASLVHLNYQLSVDLHVKNNQDNSPLTTSAETYGTVPVQSGVTESALVPTKDRKPSILAHTL
jgi:hypothetical protein